VKPSVLTGVGRSQLRGRFSPGGTAPSHQERDQAGPAGLMRRTQPTPADSPKTGRCPSFPRRKMRGPIIAITLVLLSVFVPVAFAYNRKTHISATMCCFMSSLMAPEERQGRRRVAHCLQACQIGLLRAQPGRGAAIGSATEKASAPQAGWREGGSPAWADAGARPVPTRLCSGGCA